ncbi:PfaD family polyunsaturated fatty acid/polyketide biosynthesis protein [Saccharothrix sp. SC076]|nr:PfaD family polyunsaturated fatty acid/polyketide biosynthesis protein [Saccharothrix obliqua]
MGGDLFDRFPEHRATADRVIGVPVARLCLEDPDHLLRDTRYAQPALFVVNALSYLAAEAGPPDFFAGHSLGEYNALFAAGSLDFATALELVCRRGEVMSRAAGGGMVAVIGAGPDRLRGLLADAGVADVDVANDNSTTQVVLSGPLDSLAAATKAVRAAGAARCVPLAVSAAFHSRHMRAAAREFEDVLADIRFAPPRVPVFSNVTARPHDPGLIGDMLALQVRSPVRWRETMDRLAAAGVREVREFGPGRVLTELWRAVGAEPSGSGGVPGKRCEVPPAAAAKRAAPPPGPVAGVVRGAAVQAESGSAGAGLSGPESLGDAAFRADYGVRWSYLTGSMFRGIASVRLVERMGRAGLLGFFGAGGLRYDEVVAAVRALGSSPGPGRFGVNLLAMPDHPALEARLADLYVREGVRYVEAAGFTDVTAPLVRFRFAGARFAADGTPVAARHLVAKVSRPEVAAAFLRPPPPAVLAALVRDGALSREEARAAERLPVAGDLCAEADSAGHTDARSALTLVPDLALLRDRVAAEHGYAKRIRVGAAGGLGTPAAVAAAFVLGADFVVTGSVNQATPEAGTSDLVKDMLAAAGVQDTAYAPAGDVFESGARVQVLRRGTMFAARANQLHQLYQRYGSWEEVPEQVRAGVERHTFRRPFAEVWRETTRHHRETGRAGLVEHADPKRRMALAFRWYFAHTTAAALRGDPAERAGFQVHTGPAIGAFNRLVAGTGLADWRLRHVDVIAELLMRGAADVIARSRDHK